MRAGIFLTYCLLTGACATSNTSMSSLGENPSRSDLKEYASSLIERSSGGWDTIIDGDVAEALSIAMDHVKTLVSPEDMVLNVGSRLIAVRETDDYIELGIFAKIVPSREIFGDIEQRCKLYCYRFDLGTRFLVRVDRETKEILSVKNMPA